MGIWVFLCGDVGSYGGGVGISMWGCRELDRGCVYICVGGVGSYGGNVGISVWGVGSYGGNMGIWVLLCGRVGGRVVSGV